MKGSSDSFLGVISVTLGGILLVGGSLIAATILSTVAGWFIGWVVGWFFGDTILMFLSQVGIHGFTMAQVGASLGFVGSFFRSSLKAEKND